MATQFTPQSLINSRLALGQSLLGQAGQGRPGVAPLANLLMGITGGLHSNYANRATEGNKAYRTELLSGLQGQSPEAMASILLGSEDPNFQNAGLSLIAKQPSELDTRLKKAQTEKAEAETRKLGEPEQPKPSDVAGMRKEFTKLSGEFLKVRDAYTRLQASAENPSPAGDLSMIFNYMKMLDPGSVVRESEFRTAALAGSYGERIKQMVGNAIAGAGLSDAQRADFLDRGQQLYTAQAANHKKLEEVFSSLATRQSFDPQNVVPDFSPTDLPEAPPSPPTANLPPRTEGGMIPPDAVRDLQSNPSLRDAFEKKYGISADAYLR